MGIFDYLLVIAIGIFAHKVRGRNGVVWGAATLLFISVGQIYIQLGGGVEWMWTLFVCGVAMLLLVGLKPGSKKATGAVECPFCAESISSKAKVCKHCGKDVPSPLAIVEPVATAQAKTAPLTVKAAGSDKAPKRKNWFQCYARELAGLVMASVIVGAATGKFGNVFSGISQAVTSDTSHVFSATRKMDGQFRSDIDISKKGEADIGTFASMGNMMLGQARLRDAESAYFIAANIAKNLHGAESVEYAKVMDGLAFMYYAVCTEDYYAPKKGGRSSEERNACTAAERLFQLSISTYDKKLGASSHEANSARDSYASMLEILDRQDEADRVRKLIVKAPISIPQPVTAQPAVQISNAPSFPLNEGYASVRQKLLAAGWQPFHAVDADACAEGDARCQGRPEMEACAGTGMANCRFLWQRDGKTVVVMTVGEDAAFAGIEPRN